MLLMCLLVDADSVDDTVDTTTHKFGVVKETVAIDNHISPTATEKDSIDEAIEAALRKCSSNSGGRITVRKGSIDERMETTTLPKGSSSGKSPQEGAIGSPGRKPRRRTKSESLVGSSPDRLQVRSVSKEDSVGRKRKQKEKTSPAGSGSNSVKSPVGKSNDGGKGLSPQLQLDSLVPLSSSSDDEDTGIGNEGDFSDDDDDLQLVEMPATASRFNSARKRAVSQKKSAVVSPSKKVEAETNTEMLTEVAPPVKRADFETQVDLPGVVGGAAPVKKTATFDVGIQVDPADTLEFITAHSDSHSTGTVVMSSEIAIQATGPDDSDAVVPPGVSVNPAGSSPHRQDGVVIETNSCYTDRPVGQEYPDRSDDSGQVATPVASQEVTRSHTSVIRHTPIGQTSVVTRRSGDRPAVVVITVDTSSSKSEKADFVESVERTERPTGHRTTGRMRMQQARKELSLNDDALNKELYQTSEKRQLRRVCKSGTKTSVETSDSTEPTAPGVTQQAATDTAKSSDTAGVTTTEHVSDQLLTTDVQTVVGCADCAALQRPVRGHGRRGRRRVRKLGGATVESNCVVMLDRLENMPGEGREQQSLGRGRTKLGKDQEPAKTVVDTVPPSNQDSENKKSTTENEADHAMSSDDHIEADDDDDITKDEDGDEVAMDTSDQGSSRTNSEYEPLPVQQQLKRRKRRIWPGHDMGYSKPRRKRRRKKLPAPSAGTDTQVLMSDDESCEAG